MTSSPGGLPGEIFASETSAGASITCSQRKTSRGLRSPAWFCASSAPATTDRSSPPSATNRRLDTASHRAAHGVKRGHALPSLVDQATLVALCRALGLSDDGRRAAEESSGPP